MFRAQISLPGLALAAIVALPGLSACGQAPGAMGADMDLTARMPLLMPDDFSDMHLVAWRVETGVVDPQNPLIEGETPWDAGGVGIHGTVFKDPLDGMWKAYLTCTPADFAEVKPWASENHASRRLCLFESTDGVHWTRPEFSSIAAEGDQQTNIVFDLKEGVAAYPSVFVDPENRDWPYDMFVLREAWGHPAHGTPPEGNGFYRYRSRDGRTWELVGKITGPMTGDLGMVQRNPNGTGYICYYRLGGPRQPTDHVPAWEDTARRTCMRATSVDGTTWEKDPVMTLTGDERDHRDTQYQECVPLKVKGGYVAMVTMYHPITQTLNLRMAASRDGRSWWFPDRVPCLDNAPLGDYGGGMIWQSQNLIVQGEKLFVYYGGTEGPHRLISDTRAPSVAIGPHERVIDHGAHFLPFNAALCRASWRVDRMYALVSSAGGPTIGAATTHPRPLGGGRLWVNLRTRPAKQSTRSLSGTHPAPSPPSAAPVEIGSRDGVRESSDSRTGVKQTSNEGSLQVELLDQEGRPLPGFSRQDCPELKGDRQALQVTWTGGDVAPPEARQARFYLKRALLYGFEFRGLHEEVASAQEPKVSQQIELLPYVWEGPYSKMRATYACPHDDGLCADLRVPWLAPGERIILRAAEIVGCESSYLYDDHFPTQELQGRGRDYRHIPFRWNTDKAPAELSAVCRVPGKGEFALRLARGVDCVDIELSVRNDQAQPMEYVDWYFCPVTYEAPSVINRDLDRTYFFDGTGLCLLNAHGGKSETMFEVVGEQGAGGFIPPLHAAHARNKIQAKAPLIVVENHARTHALGLAFERAHSLFSSAGNGCYHADPYFGHDLKPGEQRHIRGRLYLAKGSAGDVLAKFQRDFPPQP